MLVYRTTSLYFAPVGVDVEAIIVPITEDLLPKIVPGWWQDSGLISAFVPKPIDLDWQWGDVEVEIDGRLFTAQKIAIVTGDGEVQGAAMVTTEPVDSALEPGQGALFLERLFTAPRNRPNLRVDGRPYFLGVGAELLTWAVEMSKLLGYSGRLRLDGSPDAIDWYKKRGLKSLDMDSMLFEGTEFTPMELPAIAAAMLLNVPHKTQRRKR